MDKNKIVFSIFATIFFANFSFGMDDLPLPDIPDMPDGLEESEDGEYNNNYNEYKYLLEDWRDLLNNAELAPMDAAQTGRFNSNQGAQRRINFNP